MTYKLIRSALLNLSIFAFVSTGSTCSLRARSTTIANLPGFSIYLTFPKNFSYLYKKIIASGTILKFAITTAVLTIVILFGLNAPAQNPGDTLTGSKDTGASSSSKLVSPYFEAELKNGYLYLDKIKSGDTLISYLFVIFVIVLIGIFNDFSIIRLFGFFDYISVNILPINLVAISFAGKNSWIKNISLPG